MLASMALVYAVAMIFTQQIIIINWAGYWTTIHMHFNYSVYYLYPHRK
jgi:hypothetical protein